MWKKRMKRASRETLLINQQKSQTRRNAVLSCRFRIKRDGKGGKKNHLKFFFHLMFCGFPSFSTLIKKAEKLSPHNDVKLLLPSQAIFLEGKLWESGDGDYDTFFIRQRKNFSPPLFWLIFSIFEKAKKQREKSFWLKCFLILFLWWKARKFAFMQLPSPEERKLWETN